MTASPLGTEYASVDDHDFTARYHASCHCGTVRYEARADPVDAKLCHCRDCQVLHGAPMQWAAIFHKRDVRFTAGIEHLRFYHAPSRAEARERPCKVACRRCGTPIADEGRNMWLAFPSLFEFGTPTVPRAFQPSAHIFYSSRVMEVDDGLPKWSGHKERSRLVG
ncbi:MAG: GFA family protein [Gammaproteobacteria bacterium]|jgi:hypothetical protein|nr:MAG: GFA family protein [Gammaproteobacteria bacterium]